MSACALHEWKTWLRSSPRTAASAAGSAIGSMVLMMSPPDAADSVVAREAEADLARWGRASGSSTLLRV
jgi:hypothetical protein